MIIDIKVTGITPIYQKNSALCAKKVYSTNTNIIQYQKMHIHNSCQQIKSCDCINCGYTGT